MKQYVYYLFSSVVFAMLFALLGILYTVEPVQSDVASGFVVDLRGIERLDGRMYYLGQVQQEGRVLQGYAMVTYALGSDDFTSQCGNKVCEEGEDRRICPLDCRMGPDASTCYQVIQPGARWKHIEPYIVDLANFYCLDAEFISESLKLGIQQWEHAAEYDILGSEAEGVADGVDLLAPDGINEVVFGNIEATGAMAVTVLWGVFEGPLEKQEILEWDQMYDGVDFDWSRSGEKDKVDFVSLALHELGRSMGLRDLYFDGCSDQTMYAYIKFGSVLKRTLEAGDITGIRKLY